MPTNSLLDYFHIFFSFEHPKVNSRLQFTIKGNAFKGMCTMYIHSIYALQEYAMKAKNVRYDRTSLNVPPSRSKIHRTRKTLTLTDFSSFFCSFDPPIAIIMFGFFSPFLLVLLVQFAPPRPFFFSHSG